jgi:isopentenyldiphosphate isomerase
MSNQKFKTTDPQNEQLIQVDEHNEVIGGVTRIKAHSTPGIYYRTIFILVKNNKGEVLIQKRSPTKDLYPNCWDLSVGGHVNFGKSYVETAVRELKEELGVEAKDEDFILKGEVLVKLPKSNEFFNVFEYQLKPNQEILTEKNEISDIAWISIKNIKKSMADKSLLWYARPEQVIDALY